MEADAHALIALFGLVGAVVVGGTLLAGPTERTGLPALAVFLLLGLAIGPYGFGLLTVALDEPLLRVVATLSLTLVLFTDAMTLDLREVRRNKVLAALLLGPGTLLVAFGLAAIGWGLLGLSAEAAIILGAALASTDPVMLRGMLQGSSLSERLRLALRLESGMNDVLLLPIVILALTFGAAAGLPTTNEIGRLLISLFVLGPLAGGLVGFGAVRLLVWVRDRFGVRREYEALYVIGVALAAFAAAEALGGSGFLSAFAAGLVVSALDLELCDCFLEYGQITAEMALLFTYVLLGTLPIWSGLAIIGPLTLLFAAIVLFVRLPIFAVALGQLRLPMYERLLIGWYGPRGLGSLLLALLAVFDGLPAGQQIVALTSLAVLVSVVLQGGWPLLRRRLRPATQTQASPPEVGVATPQPRDPLLLVQSPLPDRMTIEQLRRHHGHDEPIVIIDVRSERSYRASTEIAAGAVRVSPDHAVETLTKHGISPDAWVVAYCT